MVGYLLEENNKQMDAIKDMVSRAVVEVCEAAAPSYDINPNPQHHRIMHLSTLAFRIHTIRTHALL